MEAKCTNRRPNKRKTKYYTDRPKKYAHKPRKQEARISKMRNRRGYDLVGFYTYLFPAHSLQHLLNVAAVGGLQPPPVQRLWRTYLHPPYSYNIL